MSAPLPTLTVHTLLFHCACGHTEHLVVNGIRECVVWCRRCEHVWALLVEGAVSPGAHGVGAALVALPAEEEKRYRTQLRAAARGLVVMS